MNTPLHMATYAINPKWYISRPGRIAPIQDPEFELPLQRCTVKRRGKHFGDSGFSL